MAMAASWLGKASVVVVNVCGLVEATAGTRFGPGDSLPLDWRLSLTAAGDPSNSGHLLPVSPTDPEYAPAVAWLRWWVYGDQGGRTYFEGANATLCQAPWTCQTKMPGGAVKMSGF